MGARGGRAAQMVPGPSLSRGDADSKSFRLSARSGIVDRTVDEFEWPTITGLYPPHLHEDNSPSTTRVSRRISGHKPESERSGKPGPSEVTGFVARQGSREVRGSYEGIFELERHRGALEILLVLDGERYATKPRLRQRLRPGQVALSGALRSLMRLGLIAPHPVSTFPFGTTYGLTETGIKFTQTPLRSWPYLLRGPFSGPPEDKPSDRTAQRAFRRIPSVVRQADSDD
jgi:DNA-binding HxlR family transcriptional regulator